MLAIGRTGRYVQQVTGYRAFIPAPLPPDPPVQLERLQPLLSQADQAVGRLAGISLMLPNPDLFVAMYVRREAVLSSQIEGTQTTLEDLLSFELDPSGREVPQDVEEVVNYVRAMNYGLQRLTTLSLSLRLIREVHGELLRHTRGADKHPGEFRTSQNWIGRANTPLSQASFVPPPVTEMQEALHNFEQFLHQDHDLPVLIHCGLLHSQFETIHPFLDGNGRVGRLLIVLLLVHRGILSQPVLYLSLYLKRHQSEYYERLTSVHDDGNWEDWLRFFLRGVQEAAVEAASVAADIVTLRERHRTALQQYDLSRYGLMLLDLLFQQPVINVSLVQERLKISFKTASKLVAQFEELHLLGETTGGRRRRRYRYSPYLALFQDAASI